jgi:hypothetical protein
MMSSRRRIGYPRLARRHYIRSGEGLEMAKILENVGSGVTSRRFGKLLNFCCHQGRT